MAVFTALSSLPRITGASQRVLAVAAVLAVCYFAQSVVITFLISLLCAFLLEPPVGWLTRLRLPRALAALLVCVLALAGLGLLGGVLYTRGVAFLEELPRYQTAIRQVVGAVSQRIQNAEALFTRLLPPPRQTAARPGAAARRPPPPIPEVRLREETGFVGKYVFPQLRSLTESLLFASFIPFLVYFMLSWKEHVRRGFLDLFPDDSRGAVEGSLDGIGAMVRGFLVGNFLIAVLLAGSSSLLFWYLNIPFPILAGILSGLLSILPYIGLALAVVPPLFAALGVYAALSSYVLLITAVAGLHLVALNLLYPKLVGSRVRLNPLAVTVALLVWSWMWGAVGFLLAVPITAALKAVADNVPSLRGYARLLGNQ